MQVSKILEFFEATEGEWEAVTLDYTNIEEEDVTLAKYALDAIFSSSFQSFSSI